MKKIYFLLASLMVFFSCSNNDQNSQNNLQSKWKLTEMRGNMPNSEKTGSDMEWQEFYLFNADGTFIKSREKNGLVTEVSGTYKFVDSLDRNLIELVHKSDNEIIGNCYSNSLKEEMYFQSENIFFSSWEACDGPGLKYEKVN